MFFWPARARFKHLPVSARARTDRVARARTVRTASVFLESLTGHSRCMQAGGARVVDGGWVFEGRVTAGGLWAVFSLPPCRA